MASTAVELLRRRLEKKELQITYIENPSTAYINTGIDMKAVGKVAVSFSNHTSGAITGMTGGSGETLFFIRDNIAQWVYRPSGFTINDGAKHDVELSKGLFVVDGVSYTFNEGIITAPPKTFICANSSFSYRSKCRIYAFDLLDANGNYLFKGRPAYVEGRYGLMDEVSANFFGSASDVEFIGG